MIKVSKKGLGDPATVLINANTGLDITDITRVGVRLQSVGISADVREGSAKMVYIPPTDVPEPSVLILLSTALLGLGISKRKIK